MVQIQIKIWCRDEHQACLDLLFRLALHRTATTKIAWTYISFTFWFFGMFGFGMIGFLEWSLVLGQIEIPKIILVRSLRHHFYRWPLPDCVVETIPNHWRFLHQGKVVCNPLKERTSCFTITCSSCWCLAWRIWGHLVELKPGRDLQGGQFPEW